MNRREFIAGAASFFTIPFMIKNVMAKSEEFSLLDITWDLGEDDIDPIDCINGEPIVTWRWSVEFGYGLSSDCGDVIVNPARPSKLSSSHIIFPSEISRCNVREGWIKYQQGNCIMMDYLSELFVNLLSPKGKILAVLCRKHNDCFIEVCK